VRQPTEEGTPQGSPLSPLLSTVMLDDLDRELERRGHRFVRYADDIRIYVRSERAGQRVLENTVRVVEQRLKLRVNRGKSAVVPALESDPAWVRLLRPGLRRQGAGRPESLETGQGSPAADRAPMGRLDERRIREINRFTVGWTAYFALAETPSLFESLDKWLRRRLRQVRWKEWKRPQTRYQNLRALGIPARDARRWAASRKGYWRIPLCQARVRQLLLLD
jgi:RNA-directed DNA polymerase